MRSPFNPTRRSRNIGTAKRGHGQNNRMVIPQIPSDRYFTATLQTHRSVQRIVRGKQVNFIVEDIGGRYVHACTIDDVTSLLAHIPPSDWAGLDTFVFRQPTRKARLLDPVWGRMFYHAEIGSGGKAVHSGPAILLDAFELGSSIAWSTSLDPDEAEELERLRADGHAIERTQRHHIITPSAESVRTTQLYRTLPHEIGHWFDWLEKVETPLARNGDFEALYDAYFARPKREREAFAHRYADAIYAKLRREGVIPFPRINE